MKAYLVSYISKSGLVCLNVESSAKTSSEAIEDIKGSEGIMLVLSCVEVNY